MERDRYSRRGSSSRLVCIVFGEPRILGLEQRPERAIERLGSGLRQQLRAAFGPDRSGSYALAAAKALPEATQVADRWHLMENASAAFLGAIKQSMRLIRKALSTGVVDPALLTSAEARQYNGWVGREDENAAVLALAKDGASIKEIVRRTGKSRGIVR